MQITSQVHSFEGEESTRCTGFSIMVLKSHCLHKGIRECSLQKDKFVKSVKDLLSEDSVSAIHDYEHVRNRSKLKPKRHVFCDRLFFQSLKNILEQ